MELEMEGACVSATCVHPGGIATNIAMAGKVDPVMRKVTGVDEATQKRRANKAISTTTAESAALQILAAVENNARRVLVGPDAKFLDKIVRLFGASYQALVVRQFRKMNKPRQSAQKSAA
jgi:short-subunit dehydrogenase